MPYMVLGGNGQLVVDPFTQVAEEMFDGLGRRKRKFFKKRLKKRLRVVQRLSKVTPHGRLMLALARRIERKGRKRQRGGVEEGADTALIEPSGPIAESAPEGYSIPEEAPPGEPVPEVPAASPTPIEERPARPPEAAQVPEDEPASPPPIEKRTESGYTIEPGEEPWARMPGPAEGEEGAVEAEPGQEPESSVDGACCGGYILTGPSPKQRIYVHPRSMAAALRTPPYRGLGQAVPFWYRPEWVYRRRVPVSSWPPASTAVHAGSKWGEFDNRIMAAAHRAADPFAVSHGRGGRPAHLPFEAAGPTGLGQDITKIPGALPYIGGGVALTYFSDILPRGVGVAAKIGGLLMTLYGVYQVFSGVKDSGPAEVRVEPGVPTGVTPGAARYLTARITVPAERGKSGLNNFWSVLGGKTTRSYRAQYELTNRGDSEVTAVADFVVKEFAIGGPKEGVEVRVTKQVTVPARGSQIVTIDEVPVRSSLLFNIPAVAQVEIRGAAGEPMKPVSMAHIFTIAP